MGNFLVWKDTCGVAKILILEDLTSFLLAPGIFLAKVAKATLQG
jgi:hypothetical protein